MFMTRLEKCKLLKEKGYTYNPETGKIYGIYGKEINNIGGKGYIQIKYKNIKLYGHHYAYFCVYSNVDFKEIDHINNNRSDNCISNLRSVNSQQNNFNRKNTKGYTWNKRAKKYVSQITINYQKIYLGLYDTKEEAKKVYLEAKKKYHK